MSQTRVDLGLTLLDVDLLKRRDVNRSIDRVARVLGLSLGWHYRLDIAWVISVLEQAAIPKGATILDAGAGSGVLQFLLAERGFHVVSVDFAQRLITRPMRLTHTIRERASGQVFDAPYIHHLGRLQPADTPGSRLLRRSSRLLQLLRHGPALLAARFAHRGSIEFVKSDMADLAVVPTGSVKAVVSVSAIEHVERAVLLRAVAEFFRVMEPDGIIACTTSATGDADWFHEASRGWCFSKETLKAVFELPAEGLDWGDFDATMKRLRDSGELQQLLPAHYRESGDNGMPWGVWNPQYVPVGVIARRRSHSGRVGPRCE